MMKKKNRPAGLPKVCGADVELGNFVLGWEQPFGTGAAASRALLREIDGLPNERPQVLWPGGGRLLLRPSPPSDPQDWGRRFLPSNGGCIYIDLDHLELCLPEVVSAYDHLAAWHAMLRIAHEAMVAANEKLPQGQKLQVLVNNSDGMGNSYGSHLNFLVSRRAWDNLFHRKLHHLLSLAAYQVSSIVFTGQGKVGSENGQPHTDYQISQRADFFEELMGVQTTFDRPLVNSRDEAHCGRAGAADGESREAMARLHVIFFDSTLCHVASVLKVGVMQIILALLEADDIDPAVILDDPLEALVAWSHDPGLRSRARLASGSELTAVEMQLVFLERAQRFVDRGGCDGIVPRAREILHLWADTLSKLEARDLDALAPRLDWVLKLSALERALSRRPDLDWSSPELKHLDHLYSSLDSEEGLYWAFERSGRVQRLASDHDIERFRVEPPENTRAWTRAMLLRRAGPEVVVGVDWDFIRFKGVPGIGRWGSVVDLPSPLESTREEMAALFEADRALEDLLEALQARDISPPRPSPSASLLPAGKWQNN